MYSFRNGLMGGGEGGAQTSFFFGWLQGISLILTVLQSVRLPNIKASPPLYKHIGRVWLLATHSSFHRIECA